MTIISLSILLLLCHTIVVVPFSIKSTNIVSSITSSSSSSRCHRTRTYLSDTSPSSSSPSSSSSTAHDSTRQQLKVSLFSLCAACDRGFGASPSDRASIMSVVEQLKAFTTSDATYGLYPRTDEEGDKKKLIVGAWQMIYTNALDVLSLAASPITLVNGIYQVIESDGSSCNIIDLSPRIQALLPPSLVGEGSLLRLKVITKSFARSSTRVGLNFKSFAIVPKSLFGFKVALPFDVAGSLPQSLLFPDKEDGSSTSPGFFDIEYLDEDTLVIKQNAVAGYFISVRSKSSPSSF